MKHALFIVVGSGLLMTSIFGQGSIQFNNRVTGTSTSAVVAPIYNVDPNCPSPQKYGNAATGPTTPIPPGLRPTRERRLWVLASRRAFGLAPLAAVVRLFKRQPLRSVRRAPLPSSGSGRLQARPSF